MVDAAAPHRARLIADVESVLQEIGSYEIPRIEVWNKLDLLPDEQARLDRDAEGLPVRVWLSAHRGDGIDLLRQAIAERLGDTRIQRSLRLSPGEGRVRAWIFDHATVLEDRAADGGGWDMDLLISPVDLDRLVARDPALGARLRDSS